MGRMRAIALVIILFGIGYLWSAWGIRQAATYAAVGPQFFPLGIGAGIVLSGLWLFLLPGVEAGAMGSPDLPLDWPRLLSILALIIGYVIIFRPVGFLLSSVLLLFSGSQILGERQHWIRDGVAAVLLAGVTSFVFVRLLGIGLPAGLLGW